LQMMKLNNPAQSWLDTVLENYIFSISPMCEFLRSQGQTWKISD